MNENILDDQQIEKPRLRRRDLLPTWIKIFTWFFIILGSVAPAGIILGLLGIDFALSIYGLETMMPLSLIGLFTIFLFGLKGVTAYGLWTEKQWAVNLAIIDAIIGIIVCIFVMAILPLIENNNGVNVSFRLELIPLILYFIKMREIKEEWNERIEL